GGAVDDALRGGAADGVQADAHLERDVSVRRTNGFELQLPVTRGSLGSEPDLAEVLREFLREELDQLAGFGRAGDVLDAGVDVFRVLTEDHHVNLLGMAHWRGDAAIPSHGTETHIEIEQLPQGDVQRSTASADPG